MYIYIYIYIHTYTYDSCRRTAPGLRSSNSRKALPPRVV